MTFHAKRLVVDHRTGLLSIERRDGTLEVRPRGVRAPEGSLEILRSEYDVDERQLHLTLPAGDRVTIEIGSEADTQRSLAGRRVVYLDQNHWVALARWRYAPDKQPPEVNEAAAKLISMVESKAIILPLSSAHVVETARSDGRFRRHLATTMLTFSRGWQMRNPLRVRASELEMGFRDEDVRVQDVVTLEPGCLFATSRSYESPLSDVPASAADLHQRITSISAIFDVVIEDAKEDSARGRELATKWAHTHQELALRMRDAGTPKQQIRNVALAAFFSDLRNDLARAALAARVTPQDFLEWMERDADAAIARMPHLGRLRELILKRLRNADDRWEANDLHDAIYLSCAAGYTDLVVGEKKHTNLLIQTMRAVVPGAHLTWKLPDAVDWLRREVNEEDV